ncbi:MAG: hypothetical protein LBB74_07225 [Chitinispirillales bacterium]|jgi:hypothetical protein|nr:hypothetical protein [Chitinispirillales bacterium]
MSAFKSKRRSNPEWMTVFLLCAAASVIQAASIEYGVSFDGTLDNREYGAPSRPLDDETFFFARGTAEAGVALDGENRIRAGAMPTVRFGMPDTAGIPVNALMYFQHESRRVRFRFGAFPRAGTPWPSLYGKTESASIRNDAFPNKEALGLPRWDYGTESPGQTTPARVGALESLPQWLFGDESAYRRPYVHGAAIDVGGFWGLTAGAWVDWTGLRGVDVNEAFLFGYGLACARGAFFARHDFMMYHFAMPLNPAPGEAVKDNGGVSAETGAAWGKIAEYIDTLSASAGVIASLDRDRADMVWHTPAGGFVSGLAGRKMLAIRGFYYAGQPQRMAWGGSLYGYSGLKSFGQGDVILRFFNKHRKAQSVNPSAELISSFHFFDGKFGSSQHFVLRAGYGTYPK